MQLKKLLARASIVFTASLLTTGTFVSISAPAWAAGAVTQNPPITTNTTVDDSATFIDQLSATGDGTTVTYTIVTSDPGLNVSPAGAVTTTGLLAAGSYSVNGTDLDTGGDTGVWTYSLDVLASTITQASPSMGSTTVGNSLTYSDQLNVSGNNGAVAFTTTVNSPELTVDPSTGVVTTTGLLSSGTYVVSGTDTDASGDTGVWTYSLSVASPPILPGRHELIQTSATAGSTTTPASAAFVPPAIAVADSNGAVTFATTTSSPGLKVTPAGAVSVTGSLASGTYTVSGTDQDISSDVGTWTYTLTVTDPMETVTFLANGGKGSMATQTDDQVGPLKKNTFVRKGYTFKNWNTEANGTGVAYANGTSYSFTAPLTLYAQWRRGKVAFHEVKFVANGGKGSMAVERENTTTALSSEKFTRKGYVFLNWNTKADGRGVRFGDHSSYSFNRDLSLYAQWRKVRHAPARLQFTVTFVANGGTGVMASEKDRAPTALNLVTFTRAGYAFVSWSTKASGAGTEYANGALYPFTANVTLYAKWKKKSVATPATPPLQYGGLILGPFAPGSSALTTEVESQIRAIAKQVDSERKSQIVLLGFGDNLSGPAASSESNITLGRDRAQAVAGALEKRLSALKIEGGWSISIGAEGTGKTSSGQVEVAMVKVSLS